MKYFTVLMGLIILWAGLSLLLQATEAALAGNNDSSEVRDSAEVRDSSDVYPQGTMAEEDTLEYAFNKRHKGYFISDDVTIVNGARLRIGKGADVLAETGKRLIVKDGILEIAGTKENPVKLYSNPNIQGTWGGIRCTGKNSELIIRYAIIYNCQNTADSSDTRGGAIFVSKAKRVVIENSVIFNCSARQGGAIWIDKTPCTLTNNKIIANKADEGSALWLENTSASLMGNYIHGNVSAKGETVWSKNSRLALINCTITKNYDPLKATDSTSPSSGPAGQAALRGTIKADKSRLEIINTILYHNSLAGGLPEVTLQNDSDCKINSCLISNGKDGIRSVKSTVKQTNVFDTDPLLADEPYFGYVLSPDSPCINKGIPDERLALSSLDIDGEFRLDTQSHQFDIGAYEYHKVDDLSVDADLKVNTIWKSRFVTITKPITVKKHATLTIYPGVTVKLANGADINIRGQLLSIGSQSAPVNFCPDPQTGQSANLNLTGIVYPEDYFVLCESWWKPDSVAIAQNHYSDILVHTVFHGNKPFTGADEGVFLNIGENNSVQIRDCEFRDNYRPQGNGVVASIGDGAWFTRCRFTGNIALKGGAVSIEGQSSRFYRCKFLDNKATYGGAMFLSNCGASILYSTFAGNKATYGGAQFIYNANCTLLKSTLSDNEAEYGGGFYLNGAPYTFVASTIVYGNRASKGSQIYVSDVDPLAQPSEPERGAPPDTTQGESYGDYRDYEEDYRETRIENCDIEGGLAAIGSSWQGDPGTENYEVITFYDNNHDLPPHLDRDYALLPDSPLIDLGSDPGDVYWEYASIFIEKHLGTRYDIGVEEIPVQKR